MTKVNTKFGYQIFYSIATDDSGRYGTGRYMRQFFANQDDELATQFKRFAREELRRKNWTIVPEQVIRAPILPKEISPEFSMSRDVTEKILPTLND